MINYKRKKIPVLVINETADSFFKRGRESAVLLDQKKHIAPRRIISFEDKEDLAAFLTQNKFNIVAAVRKHPKTVSRLAELLKRSRSSLNKDIQKLESIGIIKTELQINPGHGKCRLVKAVDECPIQLHVQTLI